MNITTEIFQVMETSVITDMDQENEYGFDVSCNLGSIDIKKATEVEDFEKLVNAAMDMLTVVSDMTNIKNVPSVEKANNSMHSVGLGAMNMHSHLACHGVLYGSEESIAFTDYFFEALDYYTLKASVEIAKVKKETFYRFEDSDYANGKYIVRKMHIKTEQQPMNEKIRSLLGNIEPITEQMWADLQSEIDEHGVFHAYRGAVAPTGSISYIRNCSPSIAPITERVEIRDYGDSRTFYPMPHITNENAGLFETAYDINPFRVIDLYAAATKHVDQGISMTLYVTDEWDTEKLAKVYAYAHHKGIKSVYYVRQRLQTIEECVSCTI